MSYIQDTRWVGFTPQQRSIRFIQMSYPTGQKVFWGRNGEIAKVSFCDILVNEFEPKSRYYVHFQTKTVVKSYQLPLVS